MRTNFLNNGFRSNNSYKTAGVLAICYDSMGSNKGEYDHNEMKGIEFTSDIHLNTTFNTPYNQNYTHFIATVVLKNLYMKDGNLSLSPFE
jgi:hypothetical protein